MVLVGEAVLEGGEVEVLLVEVCFGSGEGSEGGGEGCGDGGGAGRGDG